jgi:cobalt-zinc-cadmium efflux system protein
LAHHHHHAPSTGSILYASLATTLAFTLLEVVAGFRSHSLALLSDAGHNFTDALALVLAAVGYYLQNKPANKTKTYGYGRAGVITAFLNASTLIVISLVIIWEAIVRLIHPEVPDAQTMIWVAATGLVLNAGIAAALHRGHQHDINIKAAVLHMAGDAVGAVAIIFGAIAIGYTGLTYIWSLGSSTHALSSHVLIDDMPPSASEKILKRINEALRRFGIHHTTIQFEHVPCVLSKEDCQSMAQKNRAHIH